MLALRVMVTGVAKQRKYDRASRSAAALEAA